MVPIVGFAVLAAGCSGGGSDTEQVATCGDGARAVALATGHLDGDDAEDLAVACAAAAGSEGEHSVEVFLGAAGTDGADDPAASHRFATAPTDLAAGDVNGDGVDELVVSLAGAHESTLAVLVGDGDAGVTTTVEATTDFELGAAVVHDVDADGVPDVVSPRTDRWFVNDGDAAAPGPFIDDTFVGDHNTLDRADVDGDGRPDVVHRDVDAEVIRLHLAGGSGADELAVGGLVAEIREVLGGGDLDGDGELELVVAVPIDPYDSEVQVLEVSDGAWQLSAPIEGLAGRRAQLLVADRTGDGALDLVSVPEADPDGDDQHLTLVPGRGDGRFDEAETIALERFPYRAVVAGARDGGHGEVLLIGSGGEEQDDVIVRWTAAEDGAG